MPPLFVPPHPDIPVAAILAYAFAAFAIGLLLTPWFVSFLRRNKLGKQLRVETVDGREPTVFRKYHEKKFGTPTMGGLLIWGSIVVTIVLSRLLSYTGFVQHSLLQRGQVYLPLFILVSFGLLGALDDYLNIIGGDEESLQKVRPVMRTVAILGFFASIVTAVALWFAGSTDRVQWLVKTLQTSGGLWAVPFFVVGLFLFLVFLQAVGTVLDDTLRSMLAKNVTKRGLGVLPKILSILTLSTIAAFWFYLKPGYDSVTVPFLGSFHVGAWYIPIFVFVIIGTGNAVNVTDGLDGLAGGLLVLAFASFGVLAYIHNLSVLAAFCAITAGAVTAFLWHNVPPALFFMGDTGSLALGGTLGVIALMTDQLLILPLIGFVFVLEMLSVIIQITSKKLRGGKKIFLAAPIHHHFEALEWGESKVTMRLWIIGTFFAALGLIVSLFG